MRNYRFILCLVPNSWILPLKSKSDFAEIDNLRELCSHLLSAKTPGAIIKKTELLGKMRAMEKRGINHRESSIISNFRSHNGTRQQVGLELGLLRPCLSRDPA